jgi:hypothetical protein
MQVRVMQTATLNQLTVLRSRLIPMTSDFPLSNFFVSIY